VSKLWWWAWAELDVDDELWKAAVHTRWPRTADWIFEIQGAGVCWRSAYTDDAELSVPLDQITVFIDFLRCEAPGVEEDRFTIERPLNAIWHWAAPELAGRSWADLEDYCVCWSVRRADTRQSCSMVTAAGGYEGTVALEEGGRQQTGDVVLIDPEHECMDSWRWSVSATVALDVLCEKWNCTFDDVIDLGEFLPTVSLTLGDEPKMRLRVERNRTQLLRAPTRSQATYSQYSFGRAEEDSRAWLALLQWEDAEPWQLEE